MHVENRNELLLKAKNLLYIFLLLSKDRRKLTTRVREERPKNFYLIKKDHNTRRSSKKFAFKDFVQVFINFLLTRC